MYVCMSACLHVCIHVYLYVYICRYVYTHAYVYIYICTHLHVCTYMYICMSVFWVCIHIYIHMYIRISGILNRLTFHGSLDLFDTPAHESTGRYGELITGPKYCTWTSKVPQIMAFVIFIVGLKAIFWILSRSR